MSVRSFWFTLVKVAYDIVMKFNPRKLGAHAVIFNDQGEVLVLRSRYADVWQLPGGGVDRGEHLDAAVRRECREELGVEIAVDALTSFSYHGNIAAYVGVFRCRILSGEIRLSHEHTAYKWANPAELPPRLREQVLDAQNEGGTTMLRTYV